MLQWIIYDSYAEDFEQSEREKEKERKVCFDYMRGYCKSIQKKKTIVNLFLIFKSHEIVGGKCIDVSTIETI